MLVLSFPTLSDIEHITTFFMDICFFEIQAASFFPSGRSNVKTDVTVGRQETKAGNWNRNIQEKPFLLPLCLPKLLHRLVWGETRSGDKQHQPWHESETAEK